MHNLFTTVLLLTCSLIITATQYVGSPISCIVQGLPTHPINTYCWITSTFTMPDAFNRQVRTTIILLIRSYHAKSPFTRLFLISMLLYTEYHHFLRSIVVAATGGCVNAAAARSTHLRYIHVSPRQTHLILCDECSISTEAPSLDPLTPFSTIYQLLSILFPSNLLNQPFLFFLYRFSSALSWLDAADKYLLFFPHSVDVRVVRPSRNSFLFLNYYFVLGSNFRSILLFSHRFLRNLLNYSNLKLLKLVIEKNGRKILFSILITPIETEVSLSERIPEIRMIYSLFVFEPVFIAIASPRPRRYNLQPLSNPPPAAL